MSALDLADVIGQARSVLALRGADVERFLQGTLSADLRTLDTRHARPAALLTVKGKIIAEVIALRRAGPDPVVYLLVPSACVAEVIVDLERHVIMDDVTLEPLELAVGFAWADRSEPLGQALTDVPADHEGEGTWETTHPATGRVHVGTSSSVAAWVAAHGRGDAASFHAARVRDRAPAWQHEILPDHFPPEVGFVGAVSYTKGCYRGQEPLARIHARGQVNWVMVAVRAAGTDGDASVVDPHLPVAGHALSLQHDARPVAGRWTTAIRRADGGIEGLAIVHRSLATQGTVLEVPELAAAGLAVTLEVTSGPLGDDA